jgi:predicted alpha/beta hydrolase family esterase
MKKAYIVHGWGANLESEWFPWLLKELELKGFEAVVFEMPDTENPEIKNWVKYIEDNIQNPDSETILIGHSIGCQTILRYLEKLPTGVKVGKVILVAPWYTLFNLEEDDLPIAEPWEKTPIDEKKVLEHISQKIVAIFSDNDPVVPPENQKIFSEKYDAEIIIKPGGGHFSEDDGTTKLPVVLEYI